MDKLERIPEAGDIFLHKNLTFTVTKADDKMALECMVKVAHSSLNED